MSAPTRLPILSAPSGTSSATLTRLMDGFGRWLDMVSAVVVALKARLRPAHSVTVIEAEDGSLAPLGPASLDLVASIAGHPVAVRLHPRHVLIRPLELPEAAVPFLDGIVRAQIDRLTPWSPADAAFGWSAAQPDTPGRVRLQVVAAPKIKVLALAQQLRALGASDVTVTATLPEEPPIPLLAEAAGAATAPVRRILFAVIAGAAVLAAAGTLLSDIAGGFLDTEREELEQQILTTRRALLARHDGNGPEIQALRALEQRKHEAAPAVLVVETLSRVLPDQTYLTALEIEGDKVELQGLSQEPPALVRLLEQSQRFTEATFAAPTTRQAGEDAERFHIEARIRFPQEMTP